MIKVGIVGVSGYSGLTALELLLKHPNVRVTYASASNTRGKVADIWPQLKKRCRLTCSKFDFKEAVQDADIFFLAVPHTAAMTIAPGLLKAGKTVIDLSGDYRLASAAEYKKWYKTEHRDTAGLKKAVYGLPEIYREDIKKARLISNPGCYPTASILGLAPLLATAGSRIQSIIIDAKSGVSGAGKKLQEQFMFFKLNENFKAYKVLCHQHAPEINLYLSRIANQKVTVNFVPHLLPVDRGILATIYAALKSQGRQTQAEWHKLYKRFYKTEPFVRVLETGEQPELKHVTGTNYCDIALALSEDKQFLVITSAIDNLVKGAAGQAVQNMNIVCGFQESEGLI